MINKLDWDIDFKGRAETIVSKTSSPLYKRVYYYQDNSGKRMFIIICDKTKLSELFQLKSLEILKGNESTFKINCIDAEFNDTFENIFFEIFELMNLKEFSFQDAYNHTIKKYKYFLSKEFLISKEEQLGLLGELIILKEILLIDKNKLSFWSDKTEDFIINNTYIEVKSTRSREHKHIINGLSQLTIIPNTKKFLCSNLVIENEKFKSNESFNLFDLTNHILAILEINLKDDFIQRLKKRGYHHLINGRQYEDYNFTFYEKKIIEIRNDFPCLNKKSLNEDLYSNIDPDKIKYELNLENKKSNFTDLTSLFLKKIMLN